MNSTADKDNADRIQPNDHNKRKVDDQKKKKSKNNGWKKYSSNSNDNDEIGGGTKSRNDNESTYEPIAKRTRKAVSIEHKQLSICDGEAEVNMDSIENRMSFSIMDRVKVAVWYDTMDINKVQQKFKRDFGRNPPDETDIRKWHRELMETGSVRGDNEVMDRRCIKQETDHFQFPIDQLPDHLLIDVFSNIESKKIRTQLALISRRWRRLANTPSLCHRIEFKFKSDDPYRTNSFALFLSKMSNAVQRVRISIYDYATISTAIMNTIFSTQFPAVTDIDIKSYTEWTPVMLKVLIDRMPNIRSFDNMRLESSIEMMNLLSDQSTWPNLHKLCLPSKTESLTNDSIAAILKSDKRFKSIAITIDNPLTERCIQTLVEYQHTSLIHLKLTSRRSYDDLAILPITNCTNLTFLELKCENIPETSFEYLKLLQNLSHLHLDERGEYASEVEYRSLFDANDGLRKLKYIRIGNVEPFNDNCVDALTQCCPNIESLGLYFVPVTVRSVEMIAERLRHCRLLRIFGEELYPERKINFAFSDTMQLIDFAYEHRGVFDAFDEPDERPYEIDEHKPNLIVISEKKKFYDWNSAKYFNRINEIRKNDRGYCCISDDR